MTKNFSLTTRKHNEILVAVYFRFFKDTLSFFVSIVSYNFFLIEFSSPNQQQKVS